MTFFFSNAGLSGDAIPDSEADQKLVHRWVLDDVNGTVEDSIGNDDGTVNGVTSVAGDWAGNSAGDGDGSDDIITGKVTNFTDALPSPAAVAFSVKTTTSDSSALGASDSDGNAFFDVQVNSNGNAMWRARGDTGDSNNDQISAESSTSVNDDNPHRVVINITGDSASDIDIYVDQTEGSSAVKSDGPLGSFSGIDSDMPIFGRTFQGSFLSRIDAVVDDVCLFDDQLTSSEAQSYTNPWD